MWTHCIGLFILVSALCGCETLASEHSTNLAVGVGEDVQLNINPPVAVFTVTWYFGPVGLFIVTWNGVSETVALPYQGRVELNKNTGTLTLKNVSQSDSGDYLYKAVSIATGHPVQYNGSIALNVYPVSKDNACLPSTLINIVGELDVMSQLDRTKQRNNIQQVVDALSELIK